MIPSLRARRALALRLALPALSALLAPRARAQGAAPVNGTVYDSVALAPLRGADVRLVSAERPAEVPASATTDSLGRFAIGALPAGRYVATFWHPRLDSLGLRAGSYLVTIRDTTAVRLTLATPAAARLRADYCGAAGDDSTGVLVGYLLGAADRAPLKDAAVTAAWLEVGFAKGVRGLTRERVERQARANADGWFVLCGVPIGSDVTVLARHAADSTGTIPLRLPSSGVARRDLFVGPGARGRIAGTVRDARGGPLRGARLSVVGTTAETLSDERGEFVLRGVPEGTRTLSARAVGYFPDDRALDVFADGATDATPAVHLAMASVRSVLDTIRVVGKRVRSAKIAAFEDRRRAYAGTFLDSIVLQRRNALRTSDLAAMAPSMIVVPHQSPLEGLTYKLRVRGGGLCLPLVYIDGYPITLQKDLREIDMFLQPSELQALEIYTAGQAPAEISRFGWCAYMVITTKW